MQRVLRVWLDRDGMPTVVASSVCWLLLVRRRRWWRYEWSLQTASAIRLNRGLLPVVTSADPIVRGVVLRPMVAQFGAWRVIRRYR